LALFSIVVVAAVGSLYSVNQASVRVNAMRTVLDNLNFATESMSRTIRTSTSIICGHDLTTPNCAGGGTLITLDSTLGTDYGDEIIYQYAKVDDIGEIQKCSADTSGNPTNCISITAPQINITNAMFYVNGATLADLQQPSVMLLIQGQATAGETDTESFAVQTLISQRNIE
jgi:hypothetical protein